MRASLFLLMALLLVGALPGTSVAAKRFSNPYLNAAITLYNGLEYERALESLRLAQKRAGTPVAEDVQINLYMGLIQFELGDSMAAESHFKAAVALDDEVELPEHARSPKIIKAFEKARKSITEVKAKAPALAPTTSPRPTPPPALPAPAEPSANPTELASSSSFDGWVLGARGDLVAFRAAAAGGLAGQYSSRWFGASAAVLAPVLAFRLEGRLHPIELGPVRPYLAAGATTFLPVVGLRGALGVEGQVDHLRLCLDVAYERYLNPDPGYAAGAVLLGAGAGWAF